MNYAIIATWLMAEEGVIKAQKYLKEGKSAREALIALVRTVEDDARLQSVGYGGLPNAEGVVELDSAIMDGDTLAFGAVGAMQDHESPIAVASSLMDEEICNMLVGKGADRYASAHGFKEKKMLTDKARKRYEEKRESALKAYDGHDTVGAVVLDMKGSMTAGTSTSGLFYKHPGRLGDSAIIGSGFYVDSEIGGACATGVGEDIMKGILSYEVVRLMKEGKSPSDATRIALTSFLERYEKKGHQARDISIVALSKDGDIGAYTNIDSFSFVTAFNDRLKTYRVVIDDTKVARYIEVDDVFRADWLKKETS